MEDHDTRYSISVTFKCNWDCGYCCADTHNRIEPTREDIQRYLDLVEPNTQASLSGGEPGLIDEELLLHIIKTLKDKNCHIHVNTNGKFFQTHKAHIDKVDSFVYHCSLDLRNKVWLPVGYEKLDIDYMIVVTDETFDRLPAFLEMNKHLKIGVVGADRRFVNGKVGQTLSYKNRIKLYQNYRDRLSDITSKYLLASAVETDTCEGITRLTDVSKTDGTVGPKPCNYTKKPV